MAFSLRSFLESIGIIRAPERGFTLPPQVIDILNKEAPVTPAAPIVAVAPKIVAPAVPTAPVVASITEVLAKVKDEEASLTLAKRSVAIIVGHDAMRPGAIFQSGPMKGTPEYTYNKKLAEHIQIYLTRRGCKSKIILRDKIGINGAYQQAAKFDANFIIELHFNSSADSAARGFEVLIGDNSPATIERTERKFIEVLRNKMLAHFNSRIRHANGVLEVRREDRGGGNVCAISSTPAVLIEPFFASNPDEATRFGNPAARETLGCLCGAAIIDALLW